MGACTQPPQRLLSRARSSQQSTQAPRFTHTALVTAVGHALAVGLVAASAWSNAVLAADVAPAAAPTRQFYNIPAGPLEAALNRFGREAGLLLSFPTEMTAGRQSKGLQGSYGVLEAFPLLLEGTSLTAVAQANGSFVLVKQVEPVTALPTDVIDQVALPAVRVRSSTERETATGRLVGHVAKRSTAGTKTDTPIIETPQSTSVVTRDDMDTRRARTIREALGYTAGVQVEQSVDLRDEWIQLRGFDSTQNLYRDGLRMGLAFAGYANGELNPYGLERIEVLRGPSSVLYGQTGPGGVINMITKRPTAEPLHEVELTVGSFSNKQAAFDLGGALGDPSDADTGTVSPWSYRLTGLVRDSDTQTDFVKNDRRYLAPALTWQPSADTSLTLLAHYQKDSQGAAVNNSLPLVGTLLPNPNGQIPIHRYPGEPAFDRFEKTQSSVGHLFEHRLDETWTFRQSLRYSDIESDYANAYANGLGDDQRTVARVAYTPRDAAKTWRLDNHIQAQWTQGKFDHTVLVGVDYQKTRYAFKAGSDAAPPIDLYAPVYGVPVTDPALYEDSLTRASQVGVYGQDQIKFSQRWVFLLGGRWDRAKIDKHDVVAGSGTPQRDSKFTGRTGLVYLFDNGWAPYASYSTSFEPAIGTNVAGDSFTPTEGKQVEAGVRYQPSGSRSLFSAAMFDLTQRNVLTVDPNNPDFRIQTGEVSSRGIELEGKLAVTPALNLTAGHTRLDTEVTKSNDGVQGNRRGRVPRDVATLWVDYTVRSGEWDGFAAGAGARYTGTTPIADTNINSLPARTLVDAMLRYDWDQYTASLNVTNLLDKQYVGVCYSDSDGFCGYGPTRNVSVSLRYRW